mmetsp:Transcript_39947/g.158998  ORF Transcript_39947/g.158998 Transcript_39947/m.158998 type:complete len:136 (-) Transcript_39947:2284-2691(-)
MLSSFKLSQVGVRLGLRRFFLDFCSTTSSSSSQSSFDEQMTVGLMITFIKTSHRCLSPTTAGDFFTLSHVHVALESQGQPVQSSSSPAFIKRERGSSALEPKWLQLDDKKHPSFLPKEQREAQGKTILRTEVNTK